MSTYKSIAGVSQSLVNLLKDRMTEPAGITVAPPDVTVDGVTGGRLNLYLYHLTENPYLRNQEIPGEGYPAAYGSPPLSLDLHYIFTAFGSSETGADSDMQAQYILGDAMRVLHDNAVISADLMQHKSPGKPVLDPTLLDEFEQVKVSLQPKSLEEISKIWTALPKVNFRRSVTYEVSVVQVESRRPRTEGLRVREPRVYALTMKSPRVLEVYLQPPLFGVKSAAVEEGETLRLSGYNLHSPATGVMMDSVDATVVSSSDTQIDVVVPSGQLSAGLHSLVVVQKTLLTVVDGQPPVQRGGFTSNASGFQLIPKITGPATPGLNGTLSVPVQPAVQSTQERCLLLGDHVVPGVQPQPGSPPVTNVQFQLPQPPDDPIPTGTYLMRVRIDGAESRLQVDLNKNNPTYLQYIGPNCTI